MLSHRQIRVRLAAGDAPVAVKRGAVNTSIAIRISLYNWNDQVKEDEMGRAGSTNGGKDECI
jgi:hypothetical protein